MTSEQGDPFHDCLISWMPLPDGREAHLQLLALGAARLGAIQPEGHPDCELGYADVWDYATAGEGLMALARWDGTGEPDGWVRHPGSGRRRPGGDPTKEYVRK